ncbi:hypothetical protein MNEG_13454 [Monoraphidium neglectum]|uniref:Uncharacterized protein n=1 Tax=Monoraphidium neglectum TaxID=145388 RepID=A0A0D2J3H2_9CHLO|nr:hypothetical protein MNEG_13454 [Monoraphidium neglectum]KIY94507.1 hypothetical protein MNEG_13454 [Monoraphidium neglectum]|eukprot:XP_013893527.1 hypothetical protein MNEG_13454 [Monoraphidium neglectum]
METGNAAGPNGIECQGEDVGLDAWVHGHPVDRPNASATDAAPPRRLNVHYRTAAGAVQTAVCEISAAFFPRCTVGKVAARIVALAPAADGSSCLGPAEDASGRILQQGDLLADALGEGQDIFLCVTRTPAAGRPVGDEASSSGAAAAGGSGCGRWAGGGSPARGGCGACGGCAGELAEQHSPWRDWAALPLPALKRASNMMMAMLHPGQAHGP